MKWTGYIVYKCEDEVAQISSMGDLDIYESAQKNNLGVSSSNIVKFLKSHREKHTVWRYVHLKTHKII